MTGMSADYARIKEHLITIIKVLAGVKVFTRTLPKTSTVAVTPPSIATNIAKQKFDLTVSIEAMVIGASTGGPQALQKVLSPLPSNFPVPIFCTQHIQ